MVRLGPDPPLSIVRFVRFLAKVDTSAGPFGCWKWKGTHNRARGTRRKHWKGNSRRPRFRVAPDTHRPTHMYVLPLMMEVQDPYIRPTVEAKGLVACHLPQRCKNSWCINPLHGYWGTPEQNVRDRYPLRKGR